MRLASTSANLDVVGEACLEEARVSDFIRESTVRVKTYAHGGVKSTRNFVVLLKTRAASQNLREPELSHGTLHVANLSLSGSGSLDPLRGLAANTTHHVSMGESLGRASLGLDVEGGGNGLCNARVQRRGAARNQEVLVSALVAGAGPAITIAGPRTGEGGMGVQRRRHVGQLGASWLVVGFVVAAVGCESSGDRSYWRRRRRLLEELSWVSHSCSCRRLLLQANVQIIHTSLKGPIRNSTDLEQGKEENESK